MLCTSLTKVFSGVGNVLGGSLLINPFGPRAAALAAIANNSNDIFDNNVNIGGNNEAPLVAFEFPEIYWEDALYLEANSRDYSQRLLVASRNAAFIATKLHADPRVKQVHYPGIGAKDEQGQQQGDAMYRSVAKVGAAGEVCFSYLLSFVLQPQFDVKV